MEKVTSLATQKALVIFSYSSCCMCHSIQQLFIGLGAYPAVYELDALPNGKELEKALVKLVGRKPPVPAVFIGGNFIGSNERVMALHLQGRLFQILRDAGAIFV
ncbi:glutaredoxin-C1-like [Aristolochia californica]|uniref:glutaredoxin-C1-like n=1 Tax=Aristolochia californica TaxID=171875 RepID=UPI0035DB0C10